MTDTLPALRQILGDDGALCLDPDIAARDQLFQYSTDHLARRTATYVDRILKGEKPADMPVEQPARFELVFNGKTVKQLGLKIPSPLPISAQEVIE